MSFSLAPGVWWLKAAEGQVAVMANDIAGGPDPVCCMQDACNTQLQQAVG